MLEAEFEAKIELLDSRGSILIKASNQDRRDSFGYIIVVNEDVTRERTLCIIPRLVDCAADFSLIWMLTD